MIVNGQYRGLWTSLKDGYSLGYHLKTIDRGKYGEFSKVQEEWEELKDSIEQNNKILELIEICDLVGAIEAYCENHHHATLKQIIDFSNVTKRAFRDGTRKAH